MTLQPLKNNRYIKYFRVFLIKPIPTYSSHFKDITSN